MMRWPLSAVLLAAACDGPPVMDDPDIPGSVIVGRLFTEVVPDPGPAVVLLSSGDNPMPPEGVGLPVSFSGVSADGWAPEGGGVISAVFAFNGLEPGSYSLSAFLDQDRNFHPEVGALATPTCGDLLGWYRSALDPNSPVVALDVPERGVVDGILLGPLEEITEPNPVFTITGDRTLVRGARFRVEATSVSAEFGSSLRKIVPGPAQPDRCRAGFRYVRRDRDGDGAVDSLPLLPLPLLDDVWPLFIFEFLGTPVDTVGDGIPDDFRRDDPTPNDTVVAIATPVLLDEDGGEVVGSQLPGPNEPRDVDVLGAQLTELALRVDQDGGFNLLTISQLPAGAYAIRLITERGQIWTVPNEIDSRLRRSRDLPPPGLTAGAATHQGVWLTVPGG